MDGLIIDNFHDSCKNHQVLCELKIKLICRVLDQLTNIFYYFFKICKKKIFICKFSSWKKKIVKSFVRKLFKPGRYKKVPPDGLVIGDLWFEILSIYDYYP